MIKRLLFPLLCVVAVLVGCALGNLAHGAGLPATAKTLAPVLVQVQRAEWPSVPEPWTLAGQIEQETCPSLASRQCWNPRAELKTSYEYGFGLGQTTIAYDAQGKERFNVWSDMRRSHPRELAGWTWGNRFDPSYQLQAFLLMSRDGFDRISQAATPLDRWAFQLAGYNGGAAGVMKERLLCKNTAGCDPSRWFGNVEHTSTKSRVKRPGYGQSPFDINRGYPRLILYERRDKYRTFWGT